MSATEATPAAADAGQALAAAACAWRSAFERNAGVFAELADGARIGFVARNRFAPLAGRRLAGLVDAGARASGAPMLAFEACRGAIRVEQAFFDGFERAAIDVLFVAGDATLAELGAGARCDALAAMKRALRRGDATFYALKPKHELQDAGYEDFLDSLGLAFLGACR